MPYMLVREEKAKFIVVAEDAIPLAGGKKESCPQDKVDGCVVLEIGEVQAKKGPVVE